VAVKLVTGLLVVLAEAVAMRTVMVGALRKETQAARLDTATLVEAAPITDQISIQVVAVEALVRLVGQQVLLLLETEAMAGSMRSRARTHTMPAAAQVKGKLVQLTVTALPD
jgi:hypothetical protein